MTKIPGCRQKYFVATFLLLGTLFFIQIPAQATESFIEHVQQQPFVSPQIIESGQPTTINISFQLGYLTTIYRQNENVRLAQEKLASEQIKQAIVTAWLTDAEKRQIKELGNLELTSANPDYNYLRTGTFTLQETGPKFIGINVTTSVPGTNMKPITSDTTFLEIVETGAFTKQDATPNPLFFPTIKEMREFGWYNVEYRKDALCVELNDSVPYHLPTRQILLDKILKQINGTIIGRGCGHAEDGSGVSPFSYEIKIPEQQNLEGIEQIQNSLKSSFPEATFSPIARSEIITTSSARGVGACLVMTGSSSAFAIAFLILGLFLIFKVKKIHNTPIKIAVILISSIFIIFALLSITLTMIMCVSPPLGL